MTITNTPIKDLKIITPKVFQDHRGYFMETFRVDFMNEIFDKPFIQDNESQSNKNVLRGLHFQSAPHAQAKLVRVIQGAVLDVAVDLRPDSKTFGYHFKIVLSAENKQQMLIPTGFAHGFAVLQDQTVFSYKCSDYYYPETEHTLMWNDKDLNIDWTIDRPIISAKDEQGLTFEEMIKHLKW